MMQMLLVLPLLLALPIASSVSSAFAWLDAAASAAAPRTRMRTGVAFVPPGRIGGRNLVLCATDADVGVEPDFSSSSFSSSSPPPPLPDDPTTTARRRRNQRLPKQPRFTQARLQPLQQSPPLQPLPLQQQLQQQPQSRQRHPSDVPPAPPPGMAAAPFSRRPPVQSQSSPPERNPPAVAVVVDKDRMWKSSRSIEDLEQSLLQRWGTDSKTWSAGNHSPDDDDDDDDDEYEEYDDKDPSYDEVSASRSRTVRDPWALDDASPTSSTSSTSSSHKPNSAASKLSVAHLIRETPVGGRGTLQRDDRNAAPNDPKKQVGKPRGSAAAATTTASATPSPPTSTGGGGFFFRSAAAATIGGGEKGTAEQPQMPPPIIIATTAPSKARAAASISREPLSATSSESELAAAASTITTSRPSPAPVPVSTPLYDLDGTTPLYLTAQQAERNFQSFLRDAAMAGGGVVPSVGTFDDDGTTSTSSEDGAAPLSWVDLGVTSPRLLENLKRMGCPEPLPVQNKVLSFLLSGRGPDDEVAEPVQHNVDKDVLVGTYTGSGKTLAFLVPLAERLLRQQHDSGIDLLPLQVIVMAPGRELASQIVSVARDLLEGTGLTVQLAIGGTTFSRNLEQIRKRKPSILVGTPGRLAELFAGRPGESKGRLGRVRPRALVMDEFDALLEYKPHRDKALAVLQALKRDPNLQTILCSATASDLMGDSNPKVNRYLRPGYCQAMADPLDVLVTPESQGGGDNSDPENRRRSTPRVSRTVIHGVVHVPHRRFALDTLRRILHTEPLPQQVLVFVEDARKVKLVVEKLEQNGIIAAPLSGDDDKTDRADVSRALREGYVGLVVATELAARGLDASLLTHVINWDLPTDASHYAHRAGRCGRGGRPGVVINLTTSPQERSVPRKFAERLGIDMYTVEVRNARLNIVDPSSQTLDS